MVKKDILLRILIAGVEVRWRTRKNLNLSRSICLRFFGSSLLFRLNSQNGNVGTFFHNPAWVAFTPQCLPPSY